MCIVMHFVSIVFSTPYSQSCLHIWLPILYMIRTFLQKSEKVGNDTEVIDHIYKGGFKDFNSNGYYRAKRIIHRRVINFIHSITQIWRKDRAL